MIYLDQSTDPQTVKIPRNLRPMPGGDYVMTLENTIDRTRVSVAPANVVPAALNYVATIALPDILPAGEYSYELRQGAAVLAVGVLTIGDYAHDNVQYQTAAHYDQYEG